VILPDPGQDSSFSCARLAVVIPQPRPHGDLVAHLVRSSPLDEGEAQRVVADVLDWFAEPVADFVRRRHRELASRGLTNDQIFAAVATELAERRFPPPALTSRQLRRLVYG
jgi:hypothetical protein